MSWYLTQASSYPLLYFWGQHCWWVHYIPNHWKDIEFFQDSIILLTKILNSIVLSLILKQSLLLLMCSFWNSAKEDSVNGLTYLLLEGQAPSRKHLRGESMVQWLRPRPCCWAPSEWVGLYVLITRWASCLTSLCPTDPHLQSWSNHGAHFIGWLWGLMEHGKPKYELLFLLLASLDMGLPWGLKW